MKYILTLKKGMFLSFALSLALPNTVLEVKANTNEITNEAVSKKTSDIDGHWSEEVFTKWIEEGLLSGFLDGTYRPDATMTRAEYVSILQKIFTLRATQPSPFADVKATAWYYDAVAASYSSDVIGDLVEENFRPDENITRAESAVFAANATGISGGDVSHYTDAMSIPDWAIGAIGGMSGHGFLNGKPNGEFAPNDTLTRAEAVTFLDKIMNQTTTEVVSVESTTKNTYVIEEKGALITNQVLDGNLIISSLIGDGHVTLDNVTVNGNLIIQGGGENSVYIKNTLVTGTTIANKENVLIEYSGNSSTNNIQINKACTLESDNLFSGDVGMVYFPYDLGIKNRTKINMSVDNVVVRDTAYVEINNFVPIVTVRENASGTNIKVGKNGIINNLVCNANVAISGDGEIRELDANADGVTATTTTTIKYTYLGDNVEQVESISIRN